MSRLAAQEKMLFYPTPYLVVDLIASNVRPSEGGGAILDPCCGDGEPVLALGTALNLTPHGNELHRGRFLEAGGKIGPRCTNGAREFLQANGEFAMLFDNPPYDMETGGGRMEVAHLLLDMELLMTDGLGVWIVPEHVMRDWGTCSMLVEHLHDVSVRRFPDPEYGDFSQVVVFGKKRGKKNEFGFGYAQTNELHEAVKKGPPVLARGEFSYSLPQSQRKVSLKVDYPELGLALAQAEENGVGTTSKWKTLFEAPSAGGEFCPLLALGPGHMALAVASGVVDGMETEIDGRPCLVKGSTRKHVTVTKEDDEDSSKVIKRESFSQTVSVLNLETGRLERHDSKEDHEQFVEFLTAHQQELVASVEASFPPQFDPGRNMPKWERVLSMVHAPGKLPGEDRENGLLPAQQVRAAALAEKLKTSKGVILVGEMGSGKTCCSQAVMAMIGRGNWKLVVLSPANVCQKWKREAGKVLREFGVRTHVIGEKRRQPDGRGKVRKVSKPVQDVVRAMEEDCPSVLVMSYETAKNASRWEHQVAWRVVSETWEEDEQVRTPYYPYYETVKVERKFVGKVACCPDCGQRAGKGMITDVSQLGKKKTSCRGCGAQLWQRVPFRYGGRVALADFLNRKYAGKFNLIIDELHNTKSPDSDIGYASNDLVVAAKNVLAMTGTLYSGKASSIFFLMHRLFPWFREQYRYDEVQRFVEHHGLQEEITTVKKDGKGWSSTYGYNRENTRVKEIPGVSPGIVMALLSHTAFLKLADMGLEMPPYTEERRPVPVDPRLASGLEILSEVRDEAVKLARKGDMSLFSQWMYAALGWPDHPVDEELERKDRDTGEVLETFHIPGALDGAGPLAKEEALLEIIEAELSAGRGVGVYFSQVNKRDWMGRVHAALEAQGIYSEVLRNDTVPPAEREAWYFQFVQRCKAKGQPPVLLANGNLVKEGLDLVELPTLVEAGIEYRLNDLRQRDCRSWRLTQGEPVKVIFLYYEGSLQETALRLVADKLKAALVVDGTLAEGLAAMNVKDHSLIDSLMKMVKSDDLDVPKWDGYMQETKVIKVERLEPSKQVVVEQPRKAAPKVEQADLVQLSLF